MATQLIDSGRVQLQGGGSVPMQRVTPQAVEPIGARVQAQGSSQIADALDRMSAQLFQDSFKLREQEGLQFAAQNPLTPEQFEAAKNGDLSTLDLGGNPISVFQQAVRKARALELAGRFETEGRNELVTMLAQVEQGQVSSEQVLTKINTMTEGFGRSLSKVDAEAAYKFRATMATHGNVVLKSAIEAETKRALNQQRIMLDMNFGNEVRLIEKAAAEDPQNFEAHASLFRTSIGRAAARLNDPQVQATYSTKAEEVIRNARIGVITSELNKPENASANSLEVLARIRKGDLGKYSGMMQSLLNGPGRDEKAVEQIEKNFMAYTANFRILREDEEKLNKRNREMQGNTLMIEYFTPSTPASRKREIANQVAKLNVLSIEQLEKFLDPKAKDGDPYVFANIETRIVMGDITDPEELKRIAARSGMNGQQYQRLNSQLLDGFKADRAEALRYIRRVAGVPDVQSVFASKDDQHKIDKAEKLTGIWKGKVDEFRTKNPGQPVPFGQIARDAEQQYNTTDKADAVKTKARNELNNYVQDLVTKKKVTAGFTIDENTNVDDLVAKGIIPKNDKNDTAGYLRQRIDILRSTPR